MLKAASVKGRYNLLMLLRLSAILFFISERAIGMVALPEQSFPPAEGANPWGGVRSCQRLKHL